MPFDVHPAVFASVTLLLVVFAWITFAVTCYLRRRSTNYDEKGEKDDDFHTGPTSVVVAHTDSSFNSGDQRSSDTGGNDTSIDVTGGGDTSGGDTGGGDTSGGGTGGSDNSGGDTGGGDTSGGDTGGGDAGVVSSSGD